MSTGRTKRAVLADAEFVSVYDELPLWSAPFGMALLDAVDMKEGMVALDVGCGTGFPLIELSERLGPGGRVVGIDPWTAALDRVRLKLRRWDVRNVEVLEGSAEHMTFPDARFDLIVSNNGINNSDDWRGAFAECHRVAKAGAQLVATMNLPGTMIEFYDEFAAHLMETGKANLVDEMNAHIAEKRKPRAEVEGLVKAAGWTVARVVEERFRMRFASGTALVRHHFIRLAFLDAWKAVLPEGDRSVFFGQLEERLNRRGELTLTVPWMLLECRKPE